MVVDIADRTFEFARRVVKVTRTLQAKGEVGRTLGRQLLRAGTSVGANVEEAQAAQSRADFVAKMAIAAKEARETKYWLRLISAEEIIPAKRLDPLLLEADEIAKIISAIIVSAKRNSSTKRS